MKWIAVAIVAFVAVYTTVMIGYRKEEAPHEPYREAHYRAGYALREAGWQPFPNAYSLAADAEELERAPYELEAIRLQDIPPDAPEPAEWSHLIPEVQQGESVASVEAPGAIAENQPYLARVQWERPPEFQAPQLVFFRRGSEFLVFSRVPPRRRDPVEQTGFIIPPEALEPGEYRLWLAATDALSLWTFEVK